MLSLEKKSNCVIANFTGCSRRDYNMYGYVESSEWEDGTSTFIIYPPSFLWYHPYFADIAFSVKMFGNIMAALKTTLHDNQTSKEFFFTFLIFPCGYT